MYSEPAQDRAEPKVFVSKQSVLVEKANVIVHHSIFLQTRGLCSRRSAPQKEVTGTPDHTTVPLYRTPVRKAK